MQGSDISWVRQSRNEKKKWKGEPKIKTKHKGEINTFQHIFRYESISAVKVLAAGKHEILLLQEFQESNICAWLLRECWVERKPSLSSSVLPVMKSWHFIWFSPSPLQTAIPLDWKTSIRSKNGLAKNLYHKSKATEMKKKKKTTKNETIVNKAAKKLILC